MSWKAADTAPRDGTVIIGRFAQKDGQELADQAVTAAVWSELEDSWAAAQIELEPDANFGLYFDTSWSAGTMTGWMPKPELEAMTGATEPPKDQLFLGDFGYAWALLGRWCDADGRFFHCMLGLNVVDGVYDPYFESEHFGDPGPLRWMPMPCPVKGYAL